MYGKTKEWPAVITLQKDTASPHFSEIKQSNVEQFSNVTVKSNMFVPPSKNKVPKAKVLN